MYKQILLPLDGSPLAEQALPHAIAVAEHFQSELTLLRVLTPLPIPPATSEAAQKRAENAIADMIVMCTRGESGLSRWLMGSVSDRVMRGANVPVLMIRAQKQES